MLQHSYKLCVRFFSNTAKDHHKWLMGYPKEHSEYAPCNRTQIYEKFYGPSSQLMTSILEFILMKSAQITWNGLLGHLSSWPVELL